MDKCTPESLLRGKNIKFTKQRSSVLETIIRRNTPFCAFDLHSELNAAIDLATIYRNLELLEHQGIIREVMNENERRYYELACEHNPEHPHFFCSRCGKIFCIKKMKAMAAGPGLPSGFRVQQTVLQYRGICPSCR